MSGTSAVGDRDFDAVDGKNYSLTLQEGRIIYWTVGNILLF